ncbi:MAG: CRISPR-associated endonuclease Cas2 [Thermoprotei archaeon]|nr:MAG: CRISPR-associated endonuclease Cas2 [Thermoprotei archaeon]
MNLVVVYDISDNETRERIANLLKYHGLIRVQRSVFVGEGGKGKAYDIVRLTRRLIDPETDSLIVFVVPKTSIKEALIVGTPLNEVRPRVTIKII